METSRTPFTDLDDFIALRRVSGLSLSPDGTRLVVAVAALDEKRAAHVSSLWEVDPAGDRPARRLTWGQQSERAPAFLPDGSLIFTSARPDPEAARSEWADDTPAALWLLPVAGEARPLAARPGGIGAVAVARDAGTLVLASATLPSSDTPEQDAERRKVRKEGKVGAVLHDSYPIRYRDSDLGSDRDRLFVGAATEGAPAQLRDLTGHVGAAIGSESSWEVSPDGSTVAVSWQQAEPGGSARLVLVAIDVQSGTRRVLLDDPEFDHLGAVFSRTAASSRSPGSAARRRRARSTSGSPSCTSRRARCTTPPRTGTAGRPRPRSGPRTAVHCWSLPTITAGPRPGGSTSTPHGGPADRGRRRLQRPAAVPGRHGAVRAAVGPGPVRVDHRRHLLLAPGGDRDDGDGAEPAPLRRPDPDADPGDPR